MFVACGGGLARHDMTTEPPGPPIPKDDAPSPYGLPGATWGRQPRSTFAIGPLPKAAPPATVKAPTFAYVAPIPTAPPPRPRILTDTLAPVAVQRPAAPPPEPVAEPAEAPFIAPPMSPKPSPRRSLAWVLGAGAVLVAGGAIFLAMTTGAKPTSRPATAVAAPVAAVAPPVSAVMQPEARVEPLAPSQPQSARRRPPSPTPRSTDITPEPLTPPPLAAPVVSIPPASAPTPVDPEAAMTTRTPDDF